MSLPEWLPQEYTLRLAGLYVPLVTVLALGARRRPSQQELAAYLLAFCWNLPALLGIHLISEGLGWWTFTTSEAVFLGLPIDLYLGWALLWGPLPLMLARGMPVAGVALGALLLDLVAMPLLAPPLTLGPWWWLGDAVSVAVCLAPAFLLGRWTLEGRHVALRVALQGLGITGLLFGVVPAILVAQTGADLLEPILARPEWQNWLLMQPLIIAGVLGFTAGLEFAWRGDGTPLPFDPPKRLVTTGPYAYVRNPMQLAGVFGYVAMAMLVDQLLLLLGVVVLASYGVGLAGVTEHRDMVRRHGEAWLHYCHEVRNWWPRWRPYVPPARVETLYVGRTCPLCVALGGHLKALQPQGLTFVAAEAHPVRPPLRMTLDLGDDAPAASGIAALARTLERVHLAWAIIGWSLRFPGLCQALQVIVDASGGGPRELEADPSPSLSERRPPPIP